MAELLATVAFVVAALAVAGIAAARLRLVPAVGYLAAGLILGRIATDVPTTVVDGAAEIGILVLLFLIGLELDLKRLRESLRATVWVMPFDVIGPAAIVAVITRLLGWSFSEAAAAGMVFAVSSTLFGDAMTRLPGTDPEARRRVLGVLISEDVAAGMLLAALVVAGAGSGAVGSTLVVGRLLFFLVLLLAAGLLVVPRVLDLVARKHMHELLMLWSAALIAVFAYLGHLVGSAELGALVAGVAAAEAGSRFVVRSSMAGIRDLALATFFLASGLAVDPVAVAQNGGLVLAVAAGFLIANVAVHFTSSWIAGLSTRGALQTGIGLAMVGEFSLILVTVAEKAGLANPLLRTVVVGAMVVLLPAAALLMRGVPALERGLGRLPQGLRRRAGWTARGLQRRQPPQPDEAMHQRRSIRLLLANLALLIAWGIAAVYLAERFMDDAAALAAFWGPTLLLGGLFGAAVPMLRGAYRAYRDTVWSMVGLQPGERQGAGRVRARLVDAWVLGSAFLLLVFLGLRLPQALPVVLGAGFIAIILAAVAWRRLARFHRTLEKTLSRVLGEDAEAGRVLDSVMRRYPWGVRFAAVAVPPDSPTAGRTVRGSRIAELTGAMVALLQRRGTEIVNPGPDVRIQAGDTLVILGDHHQIERAEALVVSHGEALRLEAQSRSAHIEELTVGPQSEWTGRTLREVDIREATGVLVLGVLHGAGSHPRAYDPNLVLAAGDRLIVLGTPLQVARARGAAEGPPPAG